MWVRAGGQKEPSLEVKSLRVPNLSLADIRAPLVLKDVTSASVGFLLTPQAPGRKPLRLPYHLSLGLYSHSS